MARIAETNECQILTVAEAEAADPETMWTENYDDGYSLGYGMAYREHSIAEYNPNVPGSAGDREWLKGYGHGRERRLAEPQEA